MIQLRGMFEPIYVYSDEWVNPRSLVSGSQITSNSTTRYLEALKGMSK